MTDERLAELKEIYKDRNLLEELAWGAYADHSGYTYKQDGEFLNWLCMKAYKALKERPHGTWKINNFDEHSCPICGHYALYKEEPDGYYEVQSNFCPNCGADMQEEARQ